MPRRLTQQQMTLSDLERPFHASCAISAVAELLVSVRASRRLSPRFSCLWWTKIIEEVGIRTTLGVASDGSDRLTSPTGLCVHCNIVIITYLFIGWSVDWLFLTLCPHDPS